MTPGTLDSLTPSMLPGLIGPFLASRVRGVHEGQVSPLLDGWSHEDFRTLLDHVRDLGREHRVYEAHPRLRPLARDYIRLVFPDWSLSGQDHLRRALQDGSAVIVTNHLSYIDAMATDAALSWSGNADLADRIVYIAGPKVYQELFRLLAAASIHNLPVPQSGRLGHTEALPPRELARRVRASLDASRAAMKGGRAVLLYPEGARTRTGRMGSFIQATRRYLEGADFLVPAAIAGTERAMPVDGEVLEPSSLTLSFGPPVPLAGVDPREALTAAHLAIEDLLPEPLRPDGSAPRLR